MLPRPSAYPRLIVFFATAVLAGFASSAVAGEGDYDVRFGRRSKVGEK